MASLKTPGPDPDPKLSGVVECNEVYLGGKPRYRGQNKRGRGTEKTPVFAAVERNGRIQRRVVADVKGETLKNAIRELVDSQSRIITDEHLGYVGIGLEYAGGHASATAQGSTCGATSTRTPPKALSL